MEFQHILSELTRNRNVFSELLDGLHFEMITWKQAPEKWCLLEIVCHLYDEEREDFRARIGYVFSAQEMPMPPIDPPGWVTSRNYMGQDYETMLHKFLAEREESIHWLESLQSPDWQKAYVHPKFGPMSAELFLVSWLAHDYLHIRQIIRLKYDYLKAHSTSPLGYAGDW